MPRPKPAVPLVFTAAKLPQPEKAAVDAIGEREGTPDWTATVRLLLAFGVTHMPEGWRPDHDAQRAAPLPG